MKNNFIISSNKTMNMETILIPIDFSEASKSVAEYGIQFAKERNAKLILLHVFHIPVYAGDDVAFMPPYDELEKSNVISMKKFEKELREKYTFTNPIENIIKSGFLINEIVDTVEEKEISLIIMGISEAGKLSEILLSSNINVIIGGNLDYNNPYLQSSGLITPDITVEWLLNKDGSVRVVGFNKTSTDLTSNQRNRSGLQLGYRKDFDRFSDLFKPRKRIQVPLKDSIQVTPLEGSN